MSISLSNIAAYYRACYQADFRAVHIFNFLSKKVEHPLILEDATVLTGPLEEQPVSTDWAEQVAAYLDVYGKEKALYCTAFFLIGKSQLLGKRRTVCAPLLVYPVELNLRDEVYYLKVDKSNPTLNPAVVEVLNRSAESRSTTQEALAKFIPLGNLNFDACFRLEESISELFPNVEIATITTFPELVDLSTLKKLIRGQKDGYQIVSAAGLGIVDKGKGARGILNELHYLSNSDDWSTPLKSLFATKAELPAQLAPQKIWAPATFSQAQEQVLQNAYRFPLSMVVGPPGTGKTFTIASLAVDLMSKGQSVLIASRNTQAVKVVAEKIETDLNLPEVVVKATTGSYRVAIKKRLKQWNRGIGIQKYTQSDINVARQDVLQLDRQLEEQLGLINKLDKNSQAWSKTLIEKDPSFFGRIKEWYIRQRVKTSTDFWEAVLELEYLYQERRKLLMRYLRFSFLHRLKLVLNKDRWVIRDLIKALSARTGNKAEQLFDQTDFSVMLKCMPIWITSTTEIHQVLPAYTELFDVVIIDEASQCDIASALPLLQRAKRAVIVGDPKQLRHLSFISEQQQRLFRERFDLTDLPSFLLDYRNRSLLDLTSDQLPSQEQVQLLDEHYRSMPDIIAFSNRHFYQNQLRVMTATPGAQAERCVHLHIGNGKRSEKGENSKEADAIIRNMAAIVAEEAGLEDRLCQSIGVLSPFRGQVTHLQEVILQQFSTEQILRHRILIGTPFAFQGEERDVMLISFAAHPGSPGGVWAYLNREDIFNVSITRARAQQHLYLSGEPNDFPEGNMLRAYLDHTIMRQKQQEECGDFEPSHDNFMAEVIQQLHTWKVDKYYTNYSIGGIEIDLVIQHEGKTFCVDLVGYPGPYADLLSIEHWKILSRIGVNVFALPYVNWQLQPEESQLALKKYILHDKL